jgi:hypothetical protein
MISGEMNFTKKYEESSSTGAIRQRRGFTATAGCRETPLQPWSELFDEGVCQWKGIIEKFGGGTV